MLTEQNPESQVVQELIRIVFARMNTHRGYRNASKKAILKILFQAKQHLSDDNPIKNELPFYWYKEGPYSTLIYETIDDLQNKGLISLSNSGYNTYLFDRDRINVPLMHSNMHIDEAKNAIKTVIDEFTHIGALVEEVYRTAPYKWYDTYNLKFKVRFNNFCKGVSSSNRGTGTYSREDILRDLEDVVLDFPLFPDFSELYRIFMKFARLLNSFLHTDNCLEHKDLFSILQKISDFIWEVFACGVRIKHRDVYYENNVDDWTEIYNTKINSLDADLCRNQNKIKQASTYVVKLAPSVLDMKQHPEKYGFEKMNIDHIIN